MHFTLDELERHVASVFEANGVPRSAALSVARSLVAAEAAGQSATACAAFRLMCAQARSGKVKADAVIEVTHPGPPCFPSMRASVLPIRTDIAVDRLTALAKSQGIAAGRNPPSHHAGVLALTVERFAEQGLIALMFANAPASMAPWGGKRRRSSVRTRSPSVCGGRAEPHHHRSRAFKSCAREGHGSASEGRRNTG